jgi:hypothetical protein
MTPPLTKRRRASLTIAQPKYIPVVLVHTYPRVDRSACDRWRFSQQTALLKNGSMLCRRHRTLAVSG